MTVSTVTVLVLASCTVARAAAREFSDTEHYRLPRLYHLDEYDRCLARPDGFYCTGTFRISADKPNALYNFMKEYSSNEHHFDRTLLHRGYCLSLRCPTHETNVSLRFEKCVEKYAVPGLRASVETFTCQSALDLEKEEEVDTPQMVFLVVVGMILLLNIVGSVYDVFTGGQGKNKWLSAWSVQQNCRRLLSPLEDPEHAALAPLEGVRVLLLALVIMTHATEILHKMYLYNPEFFEQAPRHGLSILVRNGSSLVQVFFVFSTFLLARAALRLPRAMSLRHLPTCLMYRVARLAPLHLLVVGFAATWWARSGRGPQWSVVTSEAALCRRRFWAHAVFAHNVVTHDVFASSVIGGHTQGDHGEQCVLPAWFLAADMQLHALAAALTLWLRKSGHNALVILSALLLAAVAANAGLAHHFGWNSMLYLVTPEKVRTTFRGEASFSAFYTSAWGSLPAALLGLLAAHAHHRLRAKRVKLADCKWFVRVSRAAPALVVAWLLGGRVTPRAALPALERPATALLGALLLLALVSRVDSYFRRVASWRVWAVLGRASLAVLLLHWLVNLRLVAVRRTLSEVSIFTIASDLFSTTLWTYVLALPLTVLVETPIRRSALAALF